MKFLERILEMQAPLFEKGGKLERLYPLFEAGESFMFTSSKVTTQSSHVRDGIDLKRLMITVVIALLPCVLMAMWNTGYQANMALAEGASAEGWRGAVIESLGVGYNPNNILACFLHGALYYLPVVIVTLAVGGGIEAVFAVVRRHEINEGFLVTWMLFPLILPPTIPLWQVGVGIAFGVLIGKEIFGGTGMNILNPALTARAFLFFAYPAQISGDQVWTAVTPEKAADGFSGATMLAVGASADPAQGAIPAIREAGFSWMEAFLGVIPGSMGETSTLACLFGMALLILTGVGSWRIMAGVTVGTAITAMLLNLVASDTNAMLGIPFWWHFVMGGWAFGMVFMATDPVSASYTNQGRWVYGFFIGVLVVLIRAVNPAYPEGMMLAILFMNVFSPLIDHVVVSANIKRRQARYAT